MNWVEINFSSSFNLGIQNAKFYIVKFEIGLIFWSGSLRFLMLTPRDLDFRKVHTRRLKIRREFRWLEIHRMPAGEMSVFNPGEKKVSRWERN